MPLAPPKLKPGDTVRTTNRASHRHGGPPGVVIEIVDATDPMLRGAPFAWVEYPDRIQTPHALDSLRKVQTR